MTKYDLFEAIGGVDERWLAHSERRTRLPQLGSIVKPLQYIAAAAAFVLVVGGVMSLPRIMDNIPAASQYASDWHAMNARLEADGWLERSGEVNQRYIYEVYDLTFIAKRFESDRSGVPEETLDAWLGENYLNISTEEAIRLPLLYQIIHGLGIPREQLEELYASRAHLLFDGIILPDEILDALYAEEAEMMEALAHPMALYYDGEIYVWAEVGALVDSGALPDDVLAAYLAQVEAYCYGKNSDTGQQAATTVPIVQNSIAPEEFQQRYINAVDGFSIIDGTFTSGEYYSESEQAAFNAALSDYDYRQNKLLPVMVYMVRKMNITRAEYEAYIAAGGMELTDAQLDAVFSGDDALIRETFASPLTLYADGTIYTVYELMAMNTAVFDRAELAVLAVRIRILADERGMTVPDDVQEFIDGFTE